MSEISELVRRLEEAAFAYYNGEQPIMTDAEYDALLAKLEEVDPGNDFLRMVGAAVSSKRRKKKHDRPMGSLDKIKELSKLLSWAQATDEVVITPKLDGLALSLTYDNGKLVKAVTRGDGETGQDVLDSARRLPNIPVSVPVSMGRVEVRGEVCQPIEVFKKLREQGDPGKNPRNVAAGSFCGSDTNEVVRKGLEFVGYDLFGGSHDFTDEGLKLLRLAELGFVTPEVKRMFVKDIQSEFKSYANLVYLGRDTARYQTDGMVISFASIADQKKVGYHNANPKFKVAWKFPAECKETEVLDITWQVGRTGVVVPVLELNPVELDGTTVSRVTGHNARFLKMNGIAKGVKVFVEKAGDIIPHVARVEKPSDVVATARECPVCHSGLLDDGVNKLCANSGCLARLEESVLHWLKTVGVLGVGPAAVSALCKGGLVKNLADLYYLKPQDVAKFVSGSKSPQQIVDAILSVHSLPLAVFLDGLGITGLGTTNSKLLASKYQTIDAVMDVVENIPDELMKIPGFGTLTVDAIAQGMPRMKGVIDSLKRCIDIIQPKTGGKLDGKSFCITGALSRPRKEIEADIEAAGGMVKSSVGKRLDFLVQADPGSQSSKSVKAQKLGIPIIGEAELNSLLGL